MFIPGTWRSAILMFLVPHHRVVSQKFPAPKFLCAAVADYRKQWRSKDSYHIMSHHIISCYIISYHVTSYHIMLNHIISCHIISIISYHVTSYHIISIISYHIIYHIISYHIGHIMYLYTTPYQLLPET